MSVSTVDNIKSFLTKLLVIVLALICMATGALTIALGWIAFKSREYQKKCWNSLGGLQDEGRYVDNDTLSIVLSTIDFLDLDRDDPKEEPQTEVEEPNSEDPNPAEKQEDDK